MPESSAPPAPRELPDGTVTFLFTDREGSTRLLEAHPAAYREAVRRPHDLLRAALEGHGGAVFETVGDAIYAAFARPTDATAAALAGQQALLGADWGAVGPLRARMGVHLGEVERQGAHLGEVERQGAHYFGAPLYRCARLMATPHGGQVVLSGATAELVPDECRGGRLRDLGEHRLEDLVRPERVFQLPWAPPGPIRTRRGQRTTGGSGVVVWWRTSKRFVKSSRSSKNSASWVLLTGWLSPNVGSPFVRERPV
jgi:class 3 adenylate cyclase